MGPREERRLTSLAHHLCSGSSGGAGGGGSSAPEGIRFRYSVSNPTGSLCEEERQFFEERGYIIKKGLLDEKSIARFRNHFRRICTGEERSGNMLVMRDIVLAENNGCGEKIYSEDSVTKLQDWQDDPVLFEYCKTPAVLDNVKSFTGPNVKTIHTMFINKPPDLGAGTSRHPFHQDLYYFPFRPADRIVASWTALEKVTRENGCLVVLPGSHKRHLREHDVPQWEKSNKFYHGVQDITEIEIESRVHLPMEAGDTVFFHPLLVHGSGRNSTSGFRKAISCHYASSDCSVINVGGTNQQKLIDEALDMAIKKGGPEMKEAFANLDQGTKSMLFNEFWNGKSRQVAGKQ